ncbi:FAD-binding oxidoreductase [Kribbella sp. NPDC004536]|uniref:FAD-binding oxidoreductase n=1 Tax=Kribbella sp. NPDC004536 TaxID=3364106 RepID=UPI0036A0C7D5
MRPRGFGGVLLGTAPSLVAQCETVADVQAAVGYAVEHELGDSLRLDLRRMNSVQLDLDARIVRVGGGATWRDLDRAAQPFCMLTPGGRDSSGAVADTALAGSSGWLERKLGLAAEALISVELVTASGELVIADETRNTELFWALHGGGANFGVASALTFRLTQVPITTVAVLTWPATAAPTVIRTYRDLIDAGAPPALGGGVLLVTGLVMAIVVYVGDCDEARTAIGPLLALSPEVTVLRETPYASLQPTLGLGGWKACSERYFPAFPDAEVLALCDAAAGMDAGARLALWPRGRAGDRPVVYREATWVVEASGAYLEDTCVPAGQERLVEEYGAANYDRLARVKCQYDPENVFRVSRNVEPAWRCS